MNRSGWAIVFCILYTVVWTVTADLCVDLGRITMSARDAGSQWWHSPIFYHWAWNILRMSYPAVLIAVGGGIGFLSACADLTLWRLSERWRVTRGYDIVKRTLLVSLPLGLCVGAHFGYSELSWLGVAQGIGGIVLGCLPFLVAGSVLHLPGPRYAKRWSRKAQRLSANREPGLPVRRSGSHEDPDDNLFRVVQVPETA